MQDMGTDMRGYARMCEDMPQEEPEEQPSRWAWQPTSAFCTSGIVVAEIPSVCAAGMGSTW